MKTQESVPSVISGPQEQSAVRLADWLMQAIAAHGVRHVFMVAGGGAMHLDDAVGAELGLEKVCTLHEQAAAVAAESYTKACGNLALCLVTTGPGGTNAVTGVAGAWLDSTPMLVISGQVKRSDLVGDSGVRQRGVQEVDIVSVVRPITKEAVLVMDPSKIRYHLERALHVATTGRPGPVWLDIPLDVQGALIDPSTLVGFDPDTLDELPTLSGPDLAAATNDVRQMLSEARRPLLLLGAGVRLAGADGLVRDLVERLGVPVLSTWPAQGIVGDDHRLYIGRPGLLAARGANFALQNSDLLLCLGARLDMVTTGYDPVDFGRNARKIVVDIDPQELAKLTGAIELGVNADVSDFVSALLGAGPVSAYAMADDWPKQCGAWRDRYPIVRPGHRKPTYHVSTYHLADVLSDVLDPEDVLVPCSSGLAIEIFILALRLHTGQRAVYTTALGAMGYGPPAALGACLASGRRRTICVDGDGGLQMNVQELETIRRLGLPVKLLVTANEGYASIRASQQRWFGRLSGADASSGVTLPPLKGIAEAYGWPYFCVDGRLPLGPQLQQVLDIEGPVLCEVPTPALEAREPTQVSEATPDGGIWSRPLEDMAPLLSREELAGNMLEPFSLVGPNAQR